MELSPFLLEWDLVSRVVSKVINRITLLRALITYNPDYNLKPHLSPMSLQV